MKLYATITGIREVNGINTPVSKGQGSNQLLDIVISGSKPFTDTILELRIEPDNYGHAHIVGIGGSLSFLRALVSTANGSIESQLKGK